jgi:hypothetical protein
MVKGVIVRKKISWWSYSFFLSLLLIILACNNSQIHCTGCWMNSLLKVTNMLVLNLRSFYTMLDQIVYIYSCKSFSNYKKLNFFLGKKSHLSNVNTISVFPNLWLSNCCSQMWCSSKNIYFFKRSPFLVTCFVFFWKNLRIANKNPRRLNSTKIS